MPSGKPAITVLYQTINDVITKTDMHLNVNGPKIMQAKYQKNKSLGPMSTVSLIKLKV